MFWKESSTQVTAKWGIGNLILGAVKHINFNSNQDFNLEVRGIQQELIETSFLGAVKGTLISIQIRTLTWKSMGFNKNWCICRTFSHFNLYIFLSRNATKTNQFTIFLQTVDVINFYKFLSGLITNIKFLLTNNYSPHQQFIKRFMALAFSYLVKEMHSCSPKKNKTQNLKPNANIKSCPCVVAREGDI